MRWHTLCMSGLEDALPGLLLWFEKKRSGLRDGCTAQSLPFATLTYCEQKVCRFWWVLQVQTGQAMALQNTDTWSTPPCHSHSSLQWKTQSHSRDLETSPRESTPTNRPELWRDTVRGDLIGRHKTHGDKLIQDTNCVPCICARFIRSHHKVHLFDIFIYTKESNNNHSHTHTHTHTKFQSKMKSIYMYV